MKRQHSCLFLDGPVKKKHKSSHLKNEANRTNRIITKALLGSEEEQTEPDIETTIEALKIAKGIGNLELFMKQSHYFVFDWCLQNENLDLLDALKSFVRPEYHFLMIEHDDYKLLRHYICNTLKLPYVDYEKVAGKKNAMLMRLVAIHPLEVSRIIYSELNRSTDSHLIDGKTKKKLQFYLDHVIPDVVKSSEDDVARITDERTVHFKLP